MAAGELRNSLEIVECMSPAGCSQHCLPLLLCWGLHTCTNQFFIKRVELMMCIHAACFIRSESFEKLLCACFKKRCMCVLSKLGFQNLVSSLPRHHRHVFFCCCLGRQVQNQTRWTGTTTRLKIKP